MAAFIILTAAEGTVPARHRLNVNAIQRYRPIADPEVPDAHAVVITRDDKEYIVIESAEIIDDLLNESPGCSVRGHERGND